MSNSRLLLLLACGASAINLACHRSRPATVFPEGVGDGPFPQGLFTYEATALNQQMRGRIILADSLVQIDPEDDACRRPPEALNPRRDPDIVEFYCDGIPTASAATTPYGSARIVVNRRYPDKSRWGRYTLRPLGNKQTCAATTVDKNGRTICTSWVMRPAFDYGWVWGQLHVKRAFLTPADTSRERHDAGN
jgi:hypothetical protein